MQFGGGSGQCQAMKPPIAADHHCVLFSLISDMYGRRVVWSKVGEGVPRQTYYDKTSNGLQTFFLYQGYDIVFCREAHCTILHISHSVYRHMMSYRYNMHW